MTLDCCRASAADSDNHIDEVIINDHLDGRRQQQQQQDTSRPVGRTNTGATASRNDYKYRITGKAAHQRIAPLLPSTWIDVTTEATSTAAGTITTSDNDNNEIIDLLFENAPSYDTKDIRDNVKCYSHLPNGRNILDCKWALGRLLTPTTTTTTTNRQDVDVGEIESDVLTGALETHCFRGRSGLQSLLGLWDDKTSYGSVENNNNNNNNKENNHTTLPFYDLLATDAENKKALQQHNESMVASQNPNLWVIKDASSNGAGGIWVADKKRAHALALDKTTLHDEHRYVAQKYVWPMVLYGKRKCHVRVYGLITSDGRAFVHRKSFLHVANDPFVLAVNNSSLNNSSNVDDSLPECVHITNCCANSHDPTKFAGEICADLELMKSEDGDDDDIDVALGSFAPSIYATVAALSQQSFPFLQGGQANNGFEYLGMDFILSYDPRCGKPNAYLLEVNSPPSQDTATGLRK